MSNPLAVSILAKLTSWYPFDGSLNDAHGPNPIDEATSVAGYSAGLTGQQLDAGSYGNATLASPIAVTATTGLLTIGGWFDYVAPSPDANIPAFGLAWGAVGGNEAFKIIVNKDGYIYLGTWGDAGVSGYNVVDPLIGATTYPLTVRVHDSIGQTATSNQSIRIESGDAALTVGRYFVVGTWNLGTRTLLINSVNVKTEPPPAGTFIRTSITWAGIGRSYSTNTATNIACEDCFFCDNAVLTQDEISYLYNGGAGRSYAGVVADAA